MTSSTTLKFNEHGHMTGIAANLEASSSLSLFFILIHHTTTMAQIEEEHLRMPKPTGTRVTMN
jgi:hypothetical protein